MRIGVCALGATSQDTGGQTYLLNLSKAIDALDGADEWLFFVSSGEGGYLEQRRRIRRIEVAHGATTAARLAAEHWTLPRLMRQYHIDVMYFPNNFASWFCPTPYVVAIRSMVYYHYPSAVDRSRRLYRTWMTPHSAHNARIVLTPSEDIKSDVVRFARVSPDKIRVIHHGVDVSLFGQRGPDEEGRALRNRLHIDRPFILYVSALWAYKNQDKLVIAFKKMLDRYPSNHQLVLVGKGVNSYEAYAGRLRQLIASLDMEARVVLPGHLHHDQLRHLYQSCDAFAFPSSYESFGNPLFEAMAAGAPVVASDVHSFPEMVGGAALLVNPSDTDAWADALHRVLFDRDLRKRLVSAGQERVADFSWTKCVQETTQLLKEALR